MRFVQTIEFRTSRIDEIEKLFDEWRSHASDRSVMPMRSWLCKDRGAENTYLEIVEFESFEDAMRNSADPVTDDMARRFAALCDEPPAFGNFDLVLDESPKEHAHA